MEEEQEEIITAMQFSAAMQKSCILMAKGIVSCFPMNKAEEMENNAKEEEVEEELNKEEEEAMQQSCTRGHWQLFPVNNEWEKKKRRKRRRCRRRRKTRRVRRLHYNAVFRYHAAELYWWPGQLFLFSEQGGETGGE